MTPATSYDDLPYDKLSFRETHPDNLGAIARVMGMDPVPPERCRVLELGCAAGANLLPMAAGLPGSRFVGIELSGRQVGDGRAVIDALGLANAEIRQQSITDIDASLGQFDYIIVHGVYSWVPQSVREHILRVCRENLAPQGIAYVSYNTYPGWHLRGLCRELMRYQASRVSGTLEKVREARALLAFLARNARPDSAYRLILQGELDDLAGRSDTYVFHEHLVDENEPFYFQEFVEDAAAQGLKFLAEADFASMLPADLSAEAAAELQRLAPNPIGFQQYLDFVRNRAFRQTLLVHAETPVRQAPDPQGVSGLWVGSALKPASGLTNFYSRDAEIFRSPDGKLALPVGEPIMKAALSVLAGSWPSALLFEDLCVAARQRLGGAPSPEILARDAAVLGVELQRTYAVRGIELHASAPRFVRSISARPLATPIVRAQAAATERITSLRHEQLQLDDFNRQVLRRLDGQHDRAALVAAIEQQVGRGELTVQQDGASVADAAARRRIIGQGVDDALARAAANALLVG